jgi:hypothetical protein
MAFEAWPLGLLAMKSWNVMVFSIAPLPSERIEYPTCLGIFLFLRELRWRFHIFSISRLLTCILGSWWYWWSENWRSSTVICDEDSPLWHWHAKRSTYYTGTFCRCRNSGKCIPIPPFDMVLIIVVPDYKSPMWMEWWLTCWSFTAQKWGAAWIRGHSVSNFEKVKGVSEVS